MRGHSRLKASIKALERQLPRRTHSKTRGAFGAAGEVEEVLIFGHHYAASLAGVLPYIRDGGCVQINGFHVLALMAQGS
jgi:hypothetical protein